MGLCVALKQRWQFTQRCWSRGPVREMAERWIIPEDGDHIRSCLTARGTRQQLTRDGKHSLVRSNDAASSSQWSSCLFGLLTRLTVCTRPTRSTDVSSQQISTPQRVTRPGSGAPAIHSTLPLQPLPSKPRRIRPGISPLDGLLSLAPCC
jgi:hypothetical protein